MKKFAKTLVLFLSMVLIVCSVAACSAFSDNNNADDGGKEDTSTEPKTQTITVYKDDTPVTYTVTIGETAKIAIPSKPSYYFVGAYDAKENGTKYFDLNGDSTMVWDEGNPDKFYARFESIYNLTYENKQRDEDPYTWNGVTEKYVTFEFSGELKNAVSANLDAKLKVDVSVDLSCDDSWSFKDIDLKTLKSGGETYVLGENEQLTGGTYKTFTYSATVPAKLVQSGNIYLCLKALDSNLLELAKYHVKNVSLTITFVQEQ